MYLPECIADVTGNLLMMKGNLVDINHACIEAALTIGQIQLPHALKAVIKCLILQLIDQAVKNRSRHCRKVWA